MYFFSFSTIITTIFLKKQNKKLLLQHTRSGLETKIFIDVVTARIVVTL